MIRVQVINGKVSHTPQEEVRHDASEMGKHATHVFRAGKLRTHGRFVQLAWLLLFLAGIVRGR